MFKYCSVFLKEGIKMGGTDARNSIIKAAMDLLSEGKDVEKITVRQVAERANVGVGLINYHFNSKNNLLSVAVAAFMAEMVTDLGAPRDDDDSNPVVKMKNMLQKLYGFAAQHENLIQFTITQNLLNGEMQTPLFIVPVLKEIFGVEKDEMQLRIIALQILLPIQVTSINPGAFLLYSGIDLHNEKQRNQFIDTLVDNVYEKGLAE